MNLPSNHGEIDQATKSEPIIWREEAKVLTKSSIPLIFTYLLQYSFTTVSMVVVGRLGNKEIAAVSLANTTYNITGVATFQGFAIALDTLCPQAYGSGNKRHVGVHLQRMVVLLWIVTIPVGLLWWFSAPILGSILKEEDDLVQLTALYLKIVIFGMPGYSAFECGKRFLQAQGLFAANLHILIVLAPFNAFLQWVLVWKMELGFIGCPIAVAITNNLLLLSLVFYVAVLGRGKQCWAKPSLPKVFTHWGPMLRLAIPGFVQFLSVWIASEIMTIWAGLLNAEYLAAQGVLITLSTLFAQLLTPIGIAAATRGGNLIGAGKAQQARVAAVVSVAFVSVVALVGVIVMFAGRSAFPGLFLTGDGRKYAEQMMPFLAAFLFLDGLAIILLALLRAIGAQRVGGYVFAVVLNGIALPVSYAMTFVLHWNLFGLWAGPTIALIIGVTICASYLFWTSWDKAVEEAHQRAPLLATT